jgi:ATP-dependent exoDNAse (exonuclease V) beta subunit
MDQGPTGAAEYRWLRADLAGLDAFAVPEDLPRLQQLRRRIERYFLTQAGTPRRKTAGQFRLEHFASAPARKAHDAAVSALAPEFAAALAALESDINAVLARGLLRLLRIAVDKYEALLEDHALLDFAGMLDRSVRLLEQQEEFARSRLKLQSRYHHVLVDEFQDTSRLQWRLIELLIDAWGEGEGASDMPTSIFVVGDRKQSIYRFRHAEVTLLDEAARKIAALRPGRTVRQAIRTSFRAVPELLAFVNALAASIESQRDLAERFAYTDQDRFPVPGVAPGALRDGSPVLGLVAESSMADCAAAVASEAERLIGRALVRTREGPSRPVRPDDIAILFRARPGHQYFEAALEARGIRTYVYKGLGFFDAPEVQDVQALVRYLAQPDSDLRAAELLRSRFVRLSDPGLTRLAPGFAAALAAPEPPAMFATLDETDRALLELARHGTTRWIAQADRVPPSELVDTVLRDSAFVYEMRGRRLDQARENVKKVRGLIRRVESRGYATLGRIAEYFETLRAGDESNAILEASGSVNLMTMHAAKGLEFPIVFLVNLQMQGRGRAGSVSVIERGPDGEPEVAFASSDATALEDQREDEELRRLLYVAATRARDRLYLAAQLDGRGQIRRSPRSLAALLPPTLLSTFAQAAASAEARVVWETPQGSFAFDVCRPAEPPVAEAPATIGAEEADLDVTWLDQGRPAPVTATNVASDEPAPEATTGTRRGRRREAPATVAHERLIGTLVHRLFQRRLDAKAGKQVLAQEAASLLRPEERVDVTDLPAVTSSVAALYARLGQRADVRETLASGEAWYEVPFSQRSADQPAVVLRGVIDCLVVPADGPPVVLEFKTGSPRPEHEAQVAKYAVAVRHILGVNRVETKILYA